MRRTNSPRFEPWHTFVTVFAMVIVMQIMDGLMKVIRTSAHQVSDAGEIAMIGFLFLGLLAMIYLTRELIKQAKLLLLERRAVRANSPRRRFR